MKAFCILVGGALYAVFACISILLFIYMVLASSWGELVPYLLSFISIAIVGFFLISYADTLDKRDKINKRY